MQTVHLVLKSSGDWGAKVVGVFATRALADYFVDTRKTPQKFWVESHEVFDNLDGCSFFRVPISLVGERE
jgi:hypothetical protein